MTPRSRAWVVLFATMAFAVVAPAFAQTEKPWARWWWPASAVTPAEIDRQLQAFADAGIGGVEITPIYGARGYEDRYIEFLSPQWTKMLEYTLQAAARRGLGVDMATGTGWPFGGPTVAPAQGSSSITFVDGALTGKPTGMQVKRAAPGGEGLVLDPYSPDALAAYLQRFDRALGSIDTRGLRAQFHDSFEYYDASWSPRLPRRFRELNGYDLEDHAAALMGAKPLDADALGRIKGDYRRTLAAMHLDYVVAWTAWSHAHGYKSRNQAHGAPGNLLDLYAAADIPETESFGMTPLPIAGLRVDSTGATPDTDPPLNLIGRFASSAAHVAGRPLASSETLTWLRENFHETPAAAKPQIDRLFIAGINHIFYHGVRYSPADAPWPGWFFYAATQLNPDNPLWDDFAAMNAYVGRVQTVLQSGAPDNDILLYWPFDDSLDDPDGLMRQYGIHANDWLTGSSTGKLALKLLAAGYSFDFVSDAQISKLWVEKGRLIAPSGRPYRALVVPAARRVPAESLAALANYQIIGGHVIFESLPQDVPGYGQLERRRARLKQALAAVTADNASVEQQLAKLDVRHEPAAGAGLAFIRRDAGSVRPGGHDYFFTNLGASAFDGWLPLATDFTTASLVDPLTGETGVAATRQKAARQQVYLQIGSGQSMLLRTSGRAPAVRDSKPWRYLAANGTASALTGEWQLTFVKGGPALPAAAKLAQLQSWTLTSDPEARRFAGTARYRIEFDAPAERADDWLLDLGDVREAARVRLNGKVVGDAWSLPFKVRLGRLRPRGNVLEMDVTNLPANRIRDLDVRKVNWKIMRDINLASLKYGALDASGWDIAPSGLLGPVTLTPMQRLMPR